VSGTPAIRPMQPEDIPPCARWIAETPLWQRYGVTEVSIAARLRAGLDYGAMIYVAAEDGEALGFVWMVVHGAFDRSGYIELIGVRPDERGRGLGRALMDFAEARLFTYAPDLFLLVSDFNIDAQRFYQHLGYRQVGALEDYVVRGVTELIYWKRQLQ
jgi:[ribosomal protein S18]-alanine N-acetyltransferase